MYIFFRSATRNIQMIRNPLASLYMLFIDNCYKSDHISLIQGVAGERSMRWQHRNNSRKLLNFTVWWMWNYIQTATNIAKSEIFTEPHALGMEVERTTYAKYCIPSWIFSMAVLLSVWRWLEMALAFTGIGVCSGWASLASAEAPFTAAR